MDTIEPNLDTLNQEKRFKQEFWALMRDHQLVEVFKAYGPEAFRRSSVLEGFEDFLKIANVRGHTCLEIGTLKGLTAIVLSRYFKKVITIDILHDPMKKDIAKMLGVTNVQFLDVANNEEKASIIKRLTFDCCYSDGDHAHDTHTDFALVRHCGRVIFHEHWDAQPVVTKLCDELTNVYIKDKFALWTN